MIKIDKRKKYFIVLDTETTNSLQDNIAYDIGYIITDKKGNVYKQYSFMVAEMFINNKDLLQTAYYKEKLPKYWTDLKNGQRQMASIYTIKNIIAEDIKQFNIKDIYAYNASFDIRALNNTIRYITKSKNRYFLPYGTNIKCIWHIACQTLFLQKTFQRLAINNNWLSGNGNILTSAEIAYRYITRNFFYEEEHQGLQDCIIEKDILIKCIKMHKKMKENINTFCWKIPNLEKII